MWAVAVADFGLSTREFWLLDHRMFQLLLDRRALTRSREVDFPVQRLMWHMANMWCRGKGDPTIPFEQFQLGGAAPAAEPDPLTDNEKQLQLAKAMFLMLGGKTEDIKL